MAIFGRGGGSGALRRGLRIGGPAPSERRCHQMKKSSETTKQKIDTHAFRRSGVREPRHQPPKGPAMAIPKGRVR